MADLNHLHLHVTDLQRARAFYEGHFGFRERVRHGDILFLTNDEGFDLALAPAEAAGAFPPWFHFGFRLGRPEDVRSLHADLRAVSEDLGDEGDFVWFRCRDPDGHRIEVYWES